MAAVGVEEELGKRGRYSPQFGDFWCFNTAVMFGRRRPQTQKPQYLGSILSWFHWLGVCLFYLEMQRSGKILLLSLDGIGFLGGKDQIKYKNSPQTQLLLGLFLPLHLFLVLDIGRYVL